MLAGNDHRLVVMPDEAAASTEKKSSDPEASSCIDRRGTARRPASPSQARFLRPARIRPERLDAIGVPRHQRGDGARVDSARQKRAKRHIADHAELDRFVQQFQELVGDIRRRTVRLHAGTSQ